jgi:hypothetical protein
MDYPALIDKLQSLPKDKQATVFNFVEFLHSRYQVSRHQEQNLTNASLANDFKSMSREKANERKNYSSEP